MRTLEICLGCANAFVLLALIGLRGTWLNATVVIMLVLTIMQIVVEGWRWQMVTAYAMSAGLTLAWLVKQYDLINKPSNFMLISFVSIGAIWLIVSVAVPLALPVFRLPNPTGKYAIGTLTYHWVDANRRELFAHDPAQKRELMVQMWYPAQANATPKRAPYLDHPDQLTAAFAQLHHKPQWLFSNARYVQTHAMPAAPIATAEATYPVLIFLQGATGFRQMNMVQVEELVSHGYIVVALDQPYTAASVVFPDGTHIQALPIDQIRPLIRASYIEPETPLTLNGKPLESGSIIPYLADDVRFALNQLAILNQHDPNDIFTGHVDLAHAGVFGVSLGGIVAAEACQRDRRLQACLMMDAPMPLDVVASGLKQPSMWLTRDATCMRLEREQAGGWAEDEVVAHVSSMRSVFDQATTGYFVEIADTFHVNFTDMPLWSPLWRWLHLAGSIEPQRAHSISNAYSLAFFNQHLKQQPSTLLDPAHHAFPEATLEVVDR